MKKLFKIMKNHSLFFTLLNIYIWVLIFYPSKYGDVFGIPIRLLLSLFLIVVGYYSIKNNKVETNKKNMKLFSLTYLLFVIFMIPSLFASKALLISIYTIFKFIVGYLLLYLIIKIKFTKQEYDFLVKNFAFSLLLISVLGILSYVTGINLMINNSGIEFYLGAKGRVQLTFFNCIYYGIFINLLFLIVFYFLNKSKKISNSIILIIFLAIIYVNLIFTFTRSAILIFSCIFIVFIVLFNKKIFNFKTLILLLVLISLTISIPGATNLIKKSWDDAYKVNLNINRFLPFDTKNIKDYDKGSIYEDYSLEHRESFSKIAKEIAKENKYTGVGVGAYIDYMNSPDFAKAHPEYKLSKTHPHSSVILIFSECGIWGLIGIALLFFRLLFEPVLLYFRSDNNLSKDLAKLSFIICFGFIFVNIMSENAIYDSQIYYIFITVYGLLLGKGYSEIKTKRVLFISSTGGHLSELMQLKPLFKKYDSFLITEKTKSTINLKNNKTYFLVYGTRKNIIIYIFKFLYNILKSIILYIMIKPDVIITTGTHTAVPMCYIGKLSGSKVIFIETFANSKTKTLSGSIIYPIADVFIVQWEEMLKLYPKAVCYGWIY